MNYRMTQLRQIVKQKRVFSTIPELILSEISYLLDSLIFPMPKELGIIHFFIELNYCVLKKIS